MSHWEDTHAMFGYELAMGLLVHQVITGGMSKTAATKLIDGTLSYLVSEKPTQKPLFERIATKAKTQVASLAQEAERQMREE